jgi:hypothetical protein
MCLKEVVEKVKKREVEFNRRGLQELWRRESC